MQQAYNPMTIVCVDEQTLNSKFDKLEQMLTSRPISVIPTAQDGLLTRVETSKILKISLPTLHDWTKKGILQSYRIGNVVRYKESEVLAALIPIAGRANARR